MRDERESDEQLQASFVALRARDAREAPAFGVMFAAAQQHAADAEGPRLVPAVAASSHRASPQIRRAPRALWWVAAPLLTAAGLGAVWLNANRRADREFDQTVTAWSQTTRQALRTPTDGLLSVPGGEYLHSMPAIGSGRPVLRSGS
jgi:hypothetical protein